MSKDQKNLSEILAIASKGDTKLAYGLLDEFAQESPLTDELLFAILRLGLARPESSSLTEVERDLVEVRTLEAIRIGVESGALKSGSSFSATVRAMAVSFNRKLLLAKERTRHHSPATPRRTPGATALETYQNDLAIEFTKLTELQRNLLKQAIVGRPKPDDPDDLDRFQERIRDVRAKLAMISAIENEPIRRPTPSWAVEIAPSRDVGAAMYLAVVSLCLAVVGTFGANRVNLAFLLLQAIGIGLLVAALLLGLERSPLRRALRLSRDASDHSTFDESASRDWTANLREFEHKGPS